MTRAKICGVTTLADAELCVEAGADAIGLNFVPSSPRRVSWETALAIAEAVRSRVLVVGVFADAPEAELRRALHEVKVGCLQFHGAEPPEVVAAYLPHAYKALRARDAGVVAEAQRYPGKYVLVDAYDATALGGTGTPWPWAWAAPLTHDRQLTLAGGLTPDNVAAAIEAVRPWCVDVASGVERAPGLKDAAKVRAFVAAAHAV